MPNKIEIDVEGTSLRAVLEDTPAAGWFWQSLPLEIEMSRWGEEYYGSVSAQPEGLEGPTQQVMEVGDIAFWEPGGAFCIFFGPTPASDGEAPVAASPVFLLGRARGDWQALRAMGGAVKVRVARA